MTLQRFGRGFGSRRVRNLARHCLHFPPVPRRPPTNENVLTSALILVGHHFRFGLWELPTFPPHFPHCTDNEEGNAAIGQRIHFPSGQTEYA